MVVLTDQQIIDELRRALAAETDGIDPRPGLLGRVLHELAAAPGERRQRRWPRLPAGAITTAVAVAVAIGVGVIALVSFHASRSASTPGGPVVGTVAIAAQAPDPQGGLAWGLRATQPQRLQVCLQIGRVQSGQIGARGQDGAFADDHRFHPIPLPTNFPCGQTDAHGHLFLNVFEREVPASAALGRSHGCRPRQAGPVSHSQGRQPGVEATCPARDLRNVAYGVLGPEAVSITYSVNHHTTTTPTGPDGAYLVVVPATTQTCAHEPSGGQRCLSGSGEITTPTLQSGVITAVTYRDGHVCRLQTTTSRTGAASCPDIGYVHYPPRRIPQITARQVATAVTPSYTIGTRFCYRPEKDVFDPIDIPCDHTIPHGYKIGMAGRRTLLIHLRFTARLAADNHHSVYEWSLGRATGPKCAQSGGGTSATTMTPIRAGQNVVLQDNEAPCPGTYDGLITYQPIGYPGHDTLYWQNAIRDHSILVGRFTFTVR